MKRTKLVSSILLIATLVAIPLTGCNSGAKNNSAKTLTVANWKGYGSDCDYVLEKFEKEYNCKIVHQYIDSEEDYITMMKQGGEGTIDVMLPNLAYMQKVINSGVVEPLDKTKLDNYDNLIPKMRDAKDLSGKDGKLYAVPWVFGTTSLAYSTDEINDKPTSLSILFDPQYKGKMAFNDDVTTAILTASLYLNEKDPYNPDLDKVKKTLIDAKNNSKLIWATSDDFSKAFSSGSVVVGNLWSGTATRLASEGSKIDYVYPKEGVIEWQDNWAIAKNSKNQDLAYKFINYMTSEEFLKKYTSDASAEPPVPCNQKVLDKMSDDDKKAIFIYPSLPDNMVMQKALSDETMKQWDNLWNEVKAS